MSNSRSNVANGRLEISFALLNLYIMCMSVKDFCCFGFGEGPNICIYQPTEKRLNDLV